MEMFIPEIQPASQEHFENFNLEFHECEHWVSSIHNNYSFKCESGSATNKILNQLFSNGNSWYEPFFLYPQNQLSTPRIESDINIQLDKLFFSLKNDFEILNINETKKFLINLDIRIGDITDPFLELNKIIFSILSSEKIKIFLEKFDDPENDDHFISIYIRQSSYSDDFIEKIWEIRDIFSSKFPDNNWILVTTDYKPIME